MDAAQLTTPRPDAWWRGGRGRGEPGLSASRVRVLSHRPLHLTAPNRTPSSWEEEARSLALTSQPLPGIKDKGRGRPKAGLGQFGWRRLKGLDFILWLWVCVCGGGVSVHDEVCAQ